MGFNGISNKIYFGIPIPNFRSVCDMDKLQATSTSVYRRIFVAIICCKRLDRVTIHLHTQIDILIQLTYSNGSISFGGCLLNLDLETCNKLYHCLFVFSSSCKLHSISCYSNHQITAEGGSIQNSNKIDINILGDGDVSPVDISN